jgi:hypothetical protein
VGVLEGAFVGLFGDLADGVQPAGEQQRQIDQLLDLHRGAGVAGQTGTGGRRHHQLLGEQPFEVDALDGSGVIQQRSAMSRRCAAGCSDSASAPR